MDLEDDYFLTDRHEIQVPFTENHVSDNIQDASCQCDLIRDLISHSPVVEKRDYEEQNGTSIFEILPNELQCKILSYLTPRELCFSVLTVCKKWHQMALEPMLWLHLDFDNDIIQPEVVVSILKRTPLIRYLELRQYNDLWQMMPSIVNCNLLTSLDLGWCGGVSVAIVTLLVTHCPLVEALNVEGCRSVDHAVVCHIVGWKKLRKLNLSHCTLVRNESVVLIAKCCALEEFNVDGLASISDGAILGLIEHRKLVLRKLYLDGDELTDVTYRNLVECCGLKELSISFADLMSDDGLMAIKELRCLEYLKVKRGSELSDASLRSLFDGTNMRKLTCLDLTSCSNFDDVGVEVMTKCCPALKSISLAWCWDISDRGLEAIVSSCRNAEIVYLAGLVRITGACLINIPLCLPKLVFLDLQQCARIIDDILEDVVRQKPDLKILDYYGAEVECDKPISRVPRVRTCSVATECS
uniref:F-box domain-containing protein n=1 Tax=Strigamia maritima TaxID=126957 RepID=T1IRK2_STRMM